ncbi:MAG: Ig-like domain-containing protein [Faecousia sp.]|nr:Ig-like domain-containing protein [Bacillota bacterium]
MEQFNDEITPLAPQEENPIPQQPVDQAPYVQQEQAPAAPAYQMPPVSQMPPVPPTPEQPFYGQPMYQPPYSPVPAPKKKNTLKIVLPIVIGVLILIAAALAVYFLLFSKTPIDSIDLDDASLTMEIGDVYTLDYEITPDDATELELTWMSDDKSVATVEDGKVTAVAEGSCTITVTAESGAQDTCEITVKPLISEEDERLLGRWGVAMTYFDGDLQMFSNDSTYLLLNEDMTGVFYLGDSVYTITSWGFKQNSDGNDLYSVVMEGLGTVGFAYATDPSSALYGNLVLILDSNNMLILER